METEKYMEVVEENGVYICVTCGLFVNPLCNPQNRYPLRFKGKQLGGQNNSSRSCSLISGRAGI